MGGGEEGDLLGWGGNIMERKLLHLLISLVPVQNGVGPLEWVGSATNVMQYLFNVWLCLF